MPAKHVLVIGASGLVGSAALDHFRGSQGCRITAVSRRAPLDTAGIRFVSADLLDKDKCADLFSSLGDVTHLVYAAVHEEPGLIAGWREKAQIEANDRMLRSVFEPLSRAAPGLRHVVLLQGTKAYGAHVRPIAIPARENRSELHAQANFYWEQETYIREQQKRADWTWTILRPQIVFGGAIGCAMNLITSIGAYAAILKSRGQKLAFPGGAPSILEAVDADLLARVIGWSGEAETARNEIFNVTNGDVFTWPNVWPAIADALGIETAPDAPCSVSELLSGADAEWEALRTKYGLTAPALPAFLGESHHYADFCFGYGSEHAGAALVSTVKLRQAGFCDAVDTEEMFRRWFVWFQEKKLLPPR